MALGKVFYLGTKAGAFSPENPGGKRVGGGTIHDQGQKEKQYPHTRRTILKQMRGKGIEGTPYYVNDGGSGKTWGKTTRGI